MAGAARDVALVLKQGTTNATTLRISGTPSVPAAMLLGSTYSARDGRSPSWLQREPDGATVTPWRLADFSNASHAEKLGWKAAPVVYRDTSASALAVLVNLSGNVEEAFARSRASLPKWRAVVKIESLVARNTRSDPLASSEAASLVHLSIDAIRAAQSEVLGIEAIHFFIAGPAGFAFMLGTFVATLPRITTYEWDPASRMYSAAATFAT
ncbi:SAVED domain-containing protein [uncultured Amnibacterium sp.]|uniref:SAVED domain-containing protein n=1 Tax=uncultured Amnibacterium sp. TaxID=1631851 RepID=UPI0035CC9685